MKLDEATFSVVDCETTGLDPATDRIVEVAAVTTTTTRVVSMFAEMVAGGPIPPETSAIHGITDHDLDYARSWPEVRVALSRHLGRSWIVAHNAEFDKAFVGFEHPWICTKRLAQHLFPTAPNFKNQTLRFWIGEPIEMYGIAPHRALGDALVTASILRKLIQTAYEDRGITTVEGLMALCLSPIQYKVWPFGKYRDKPLDFDRSYVKWALENMTLDADLKWSLARVAS